MVLVTQSFRKGQVPGLAKHRSRPGDGAVNEADEERTREKQTCLDDHDQGSDEEG